MAELLLLTAWDGEAPEAATVVGALAQLRHRVQVAQLSISALDLPGDLVLLDARPDPVGAGRLCPLLGTRPVVVCVDDVVAGRVDAGWQAADVAHVSAGPAEWDLRLRLLLDSSAAQLRADELVIDEAAYRAQLAGAALDLTYTEFELLRYLVANPGRVHTRETLLSDVWGQDYFGGTRTVDVHVRRLRAKLGPEHDALIETVRNVGYRFSPRRTGN